MKNRKSNTTTYPSSTHHFMIDSAGLFPNANGDFIDVMPIDNSQDFVFGVGIVTD